MRVQVVGSLNEDGTESWYVYMGPYQTDGPFATQEKAWDCAYETTALKLFKADHIAMGRYPGTVSKEMETV